MNIEKTYPDAYRLARRFHEFYEQSAPVKERYMKKEIKKEQLIIEITKLRQSHKEWMADDERRRKEFAKAFNWYIQDYYDKSKQPALPTWTEIFVELEKLLANRDFRDIEGNVSIKFMKEGKKILNEVVAVWGVVNKDNEVLTEQLPFYFQRDYAVSAAQQMNESIIKKKKPYKVKKAFLFYPRCG